jgi:DNA-binding Xre family transcriptional regulator
MSDVNDYDAMRIKVQKFLDKTGLTHDDFAARTGIHKGMIGKFVSSKKFKVTFQEILGLCRGMSCPVDWFIDSTRKWPAPSINAEAVVLNEKEKQLLLIANEIGIVASIRAVAQFAGAELENVPEEPSVRQVKSKRSS